MYLEKLGSTAKWRKFKIDYPPFLLNQIKLQYPHLEKERHLSIIRWSRIDEDIMIRYRVIIGNIFKERHLKIKLQPYDIFWASHGKVPLGAAAIIKNYSGSDVDNSENRRIAYNNYKKALSEAGKLEE